jgi:tetraacyldisaccharide 4'-kinase
MKTPSFWYEPRGFLSFLLRPFGYLYGKGVSLRQIFSKTQRFSVPIISVGNIVCGGSGKTPVAIAIAKLLQKKGHHVHFVTRGYGGALQGPLEVKPHIHTAREVGDEPLLLAQCAPTWMAKKRVLGIQEAIRNQADVIILDDGHQTLGFYKDLSFVVVDLLQGFGNGCVTPAGPLREELRAGLGRTDAIIGVGKGKTDLGKPFFGALRRHPRLTFTHPVLAFCGLGFPQKFYETLKESGAEVVATESFPDHYIYQESDLQHLQKLAAIHQSLLITTRKDWVRLPPAWQDKVQVLDIEIHFKDQEHLYGFIVSKALV